MGLFRPSRTRRGPDPYYRWKMVLFAAGAIVGLTAIATGRDWLILVAVPILAAGLALRWFPGGTGRPEKKEEEEEEPQPTRGPEEREPPSDRSREESEDKPSSPGENGQPPQIPPPA